MEVALSLKHGKQKKVLVQMERTYSRKGKEEKDKYSSFFVTGRIVAKMGLI